ncbi:unnamed protein product, partial [Pylaiella littoralis]
MIRAIRLVVAYSRKYRVKYARFVKWNRLMGVWAAITIGFVIRAYFFSLQRPEHYYSSDARDCFYFDDTVFVAIVLFVGVG